MFGKRCKNGDAFANDLVGCFGKLPIHMEFIKHGVKLSEIAGLDQWYQNAFNHLTRQYGKETKVLFDNMPLYHFIYTSSTDHAPVIGTLKASCDKSGRPYPLVLFRKIENPIARKLQLIIPALYRNYFSATQNLCNAEWKNYSLARLCNEVGQLNQIEMQILRRRELENILEELKNINLNDFWQSIAQQYPTMRLENFVQITLMQLSLIKTRLLQEQPFGIRFPLSIEKLTTTAIFWLQFIGAVLPDNNNSRLQIFWNANSLQYKPGLIVYFKAMPASFFAHLVDSRCNDSSLIDIINQAKNNITIKHKIKVVTQNLSISLLQTLQLWSKPEFLGDDQ